MPRGYNSCRMVVTWTGLVQPEQAAVGLKEHVDDSDHWQAQMS
jgi:hypothetical protein